MRRTKLPQALLHVRPATSVDIGLVQDTNVAPPVRNRAIALSLLRGVGAG